ncbi:MAG: TIR domain-containing protein [Polyangiales bacterium]
MPIAPSLGPQTASNAQPLFLALLDRVFELVGPSALGAALRAPRAARLAAAAYESLWHLLAAEPRAATEQRTLQWWLRDWLPLSAALEEELRVALRAGSRLDALRHAAAAPVHWDWQFAPELLRSARSHELQPLARQLGLPTLESSLHAPERLVLLFAWLLQSGWESCGVLPDVTWPEPPEPLATLGLDALWELALEGANPYHALIERVIASSATVERIAPAPQPQSANDELRFSVYRPRALRPDRWARLLAFAHRSEKLPDAPDDELDPSAQAEQQAQAILGRDLSDYRKLGEDAASSVPFEARLEFVPDVPGVEFEPPSASFRWLGEIHRAEFRMRAGPELAGRVARGELRVMFGAIVLAEITLSLRVEHTAETQSGSHVRESARTYRKIFASYSHADAEIVEQFRELGQVLGDRYLIDVHELRAGERWSEALERLIREADVFQLFWSWNSLGSQFVRREWEHALSLGRANFLRPTYWEQPFPERDGLPTPELRRLHFQRFRRPSIERQRASQPSAAPYALPRSEVGPEPKSRSAAKRRSVWLGVAGLLAGVLLALRLTLAPSPADPAASAPEPPPSSAASDPTPLPRRNDDVDPPDKVMRSGQGLDVLVRSEPVAAEVYRDGEHLGTTPLQLERPEGAAQVTLELRAPGRAARRVTLERESDDTVTVRLDDATQLKPKDF